MRNEINKAKQEINDALSVNLECVSLLSELNESDASVDMRHAKACVKACEKACRELSEYDESTEEELEDCMFDEYDISDIMLNVESLTDTRERLLNDACRRKEEIANQQ